jgi:hypothetical protein
MMLPADRPCWICGNPADSREHKFKKSDVAHSSKTWAPADQPYFIRDGNWRRIQGPDSQLVKFERKVICQHCNTTCTQPFDRAYERFATWVNQRGASLMADDRIDFEQIYGAQFQGGVLNLVKYFAKHLGCRLAADGYTIPPSLPPSLAADDLSPFEVSFARNAEIAGVAARGFGVLHNFPVLGNYSPTTKEVHQPYITGMIVGHLDVVYRYGLRSRYPWEGECVLPSSRFAILGEYIRGAAHLSDGQHPGSETARQFLIGGLKFKIPLLTLEQINYIMSFDRPRADMPFKENIETRLRISHAILSLFYPDVTLSFLEDNLTIPDTDALWKCVSPQID